MTTNGINPSYTQDLSNGALPCGAKTPAQTNQNIRGSTQTTLEIKKLIAQVSKIRDTAIEARRRSVDPSRYGDSGALDSANNYADYLGIRTMDLREIQRDLHRLGITSLGRIEAHALDSLNRALNILGTLGGEIIAEPNLPCVGYDQGDNLLATRTEKLLGPTPAHGPTRIMVTMPKEAANNYNLVSELISSGMGIMRINLAHDSRKDWAAMIQNLRRAEQALGKKCLIICDLAGPKLRTGEMETGPGVIRWRAFKDPYGQVTAPSRVWFSGQESAPVGIHASVPIQGDLLKLAQVGDQLNFIDHQGRKRSVTIVEVRENGLIAEARRGAYVVQGTRFDLFRDGHRIDGATFEVPALPPAPKQIELKVGDPLVLLAAGQLGKPAVRDEAGNVIEPGRISCSLPEIFRDAKVGEPIMFDDGKIAGLIREISDEIKVEITWTRGKEAILRQDKGINLPKSHLRISAVTQKDLEDLEFIASQNGQVDIVGMSFIRQAADIGLLYQELTRLNLSQLGVVFKIETNHAFDNLGEIVLTALQRSSIGMMIARGDLGVEVGFQRMAELQEEILALCGAAHVPVIWATQVLETLAKKGMPSRAEVSDTVTAQRAECVMLNKGPFIVPAVKFLTDVFDRMKGHQSKHFRLMRQLGVASRALGEMES